MTNRWQECFSRISRDYGLKDLYAGPPGCEGWEDWVANVSPSMHRSIQKAQKACNEAEERRTNLKNYSHYVHRWCELVQQGMESFIACHHPADTDWMEGAEIPKAKKTLFFDLETQRSAQEVGGWHNIREMLLSWGGVFHLEDREVRIYGSAQADELIEDLCTADVVVGFNHLGFDLEVLRGYQPEAPFEKPVHFDIMVDCTAYLHRRPGLAHLAMPSLGTSKSASGLQALDWWKAGRHADIIKYLIQDVRVTYEVFAYGCLHGHVSYQSPRKAAGNVTLIPTDHWTTMKQRSDWVGQVDLNGDVQCPCDRKRKSSRWTKPGDRD